MKTPYKWCCFHNKFQNGQCYYQAHTLETKEISLRTWEGILQPQRYPFNATSLTPSLCVYLLVKSSQSSNNRGSDSPPVWTSYFLISQPSAKKNAQLKWDFTTNTSKDFGPGIFYSIETVTLPTCGLQDIKADVGDPSLPARAVYLYSHHQGRCFSNPTLETTANQDFDFF